MGLIATPVHCLLACGAVITKAVSFDHQAEVRPEEIDPIAVQPLLGQRLRETGGLGYREKTALKLGIGKDERSAIEADAQNCDSPSSPQLLKCRSQALWVHEVELVRLVDSGF